MESDLQEWYANVERLYLHDDKRHREGGEEVLIVCSPHQRSPGQSICSPKMQTQGSPSPRKKGTTNGYESPPGGSTSSRCSILCATKTARPINYFKGLLHSSDLSPKKRVFMSPNKGELVRERLYEEEECSWQEGADADSRGRVAGCKPPQDGEIEGPGKESVIPLRQRSKVYLFVLCTFRYRCLRLCKLNFRERMVTDNRMYDHQCTIAGSHGENNPNTFACSCRHHLAKPTHVNSCENFLDDACDEGL